MGAPQEQIGRGVCVESELESVLVLFGELESELSIEFHVLKVKGAVLGHQLKDCLLELSVFLAMSH